MVSCFIASIRFWNDLIYFKGGFENENTFQLKKAKDNKISSYKCSCNKDQSCSSFYSNGKTVSVNCEVCLGNLGAKENKQLRFLQIVQFQHVMSTTKLLMPGANAVYTILVAKITILLAQITSSSAMFSKSKCQQSIGQKQDSQSWWDGEIFEVHLSNFGMLTFSTSTEKRMVSMSWFIPDHTMPSGTDMKFMNLFLSQINYQEAHFVSIGELF